jgi:hypothetical protein
MEVNGMKTHPMIDPACTRGHHYVRDGVRCSSCGAVVAAPVLPTMLGSVEDAGHRRAVSRVCGQVDLDGFELLLTCP